MNVRKPSLLRSFQNEWLIPCLEDIYLLCYEYNDMENFGDSFRRCETSGEGHSYSCRFQRSAHSSSRTFESVKCDRCIQAEDGNVQLFGIFSGFNDDGCISEFIMNNIFYEFFSNSERPLKLDPNDPRTAIGEFRKRYDTVVKRYESEMQENLSTALFQSSKQFVFHQQLSDLAKKCKGGCTALLVLRKDDDLYVLNCGTSLAVVITDDNQSKALCSSHNIHNEAEVERLKRCNVHPLLVQGPTRAIGDPTRNFQYKDNPNFKTAISQPVISTAEIKHYRIDPSWSRLILVSGGVCNNLRKAGVEDIPAEIAEGLNEESTPTSSAQALVDYFNRKYRTAHEKFDARFRGSELDHQEEMTAMYVRLNKPNLLVDVNTIGSTSGTTGRTSPSYVKPEPIQSYLDLDEKRIPQNVKNYLEKFLLKE